MKLNRDIQLVSFLNCILTDVKHIFMALLFNVSLCLFSAICNHIVHMHDLYILPWAFIIVTLNIIMACGFNHYFISWL